MKAPEAPNPYETAQAQAGMNRDTAITQQQLNMVDQVNPWGTVSYDQTGMGSFTDSQGNVVETPQYTQTTTFSPEQQAIFDASQEAQGNLASLAAQQSEFLGDYLGGNKFSYNPGEHENWALGLYDQLNGDQTAQQQEGIRSQLANQGIQPGTPAYDAAMQNLMGAQMDSRNRFLLDSYDTGFSTAMAERNQPINEITALLSGSQVSNPATQSGGTPQTGVGGVDLAGMIQSNYQNEVSQHNAKMGGLFGLAGTGLQVAMMSDRRLKTDIERVGQTDGGTPLYRYRYVWGGPAQIGVMADEVPEAAFETPSGFLAVDYSKVA